MATPTSLRVLPFAAAGGPANMAADEVLLEGAIAGEAGLRIYGWDPTTLSLGYFQPHAERLGHGALSKLPWVRRPTGGGAILHDEADLTYALALPPSLAALKKPSAWHDFIHEVIARHLVERGVAARVTTCPRPAPRDLHYLCFAIPQPGDIVLGNCKIVGGAQRLRTGALLQHGSMQLPERARDPQAIIATLAEQLQLRPQARDWSEAERGRMSELQTSRYAHPDWNLKR